MIGDDIESDIGGAQRAGMKGILVRTGKFREDLVARSSVKPDLIIDSIAALPVLLR
jgi:ribonucleotide monophosphatase NagD (HAD superfamily)